MTSVQQIAILHCRCAEFEVVGLAYHQVETWIIKGKMIFMSPYLICPLNELLYGQVVVHLSAPQVRKVARRKREGRREGEALCMCIILFCFKLFRM